MYIRSSKRRKTVSRPVPVAEETAAGPKRSRVRKQPAAATTAGAPAAGDSATIADILAEMQQIKACLDAQAARNRDVPAVPAALTSAAVQQVGMAVTALTEHTLAAETGKPAWGLGKLTRDVV